VTQSVPVQSELIDAVEVGRILSLPPDAVFRLSAQGKIPPPALRLTKRIARWKRSEIEALFAG
jgi:predicted DNA-binding transcriptional regulator AlpA